MKYEYEKQSDRPDDEKLQQSAVELFETVGYLTDNKWFVAVFLSNLRRFAYRLAKNKLELLRIIDRLLNNGILTLSFV
ncbi:hypothetical protein [Thalassotalea euphylliae]|uniref:Uncharacterized protein n=1 Tax=Thalassotalea euphylliae TaxID=1655234 RepID=A0A3E0U1V0_9GAMM|nr:hypothetical protein [Thalassotalea euphylliae]REL30577.1 hypothetical protein DXX94_07560 [Thalassotalea euphylliae]